MFIIRVSLLLACLAGVRVVCGQASFTGGSVTLGSSITLRCSYSGTTLGGSVDYSFHRGSTTLRGESSSSQYFLGNAQISTAGNDYFCRTYNGGLFGSTTSTSSSGTVSVIIPDPTVTISVSPTGPFYSGEESLQPVTITCTGTLFSNNLQGLVADIILNGPSGTGTGRLTVSDVSSQDFSSPSQREFSRNYQYSVLSRVQDNGVFHCRVIVQHDTTRNFVASGEGSSPQLTLDVRNPTIQGSLQATPLRILDVPPYNSFNLTCTATSFNGETQTPSSKLFTFRQVDSGTSTTVASIQDTSDSIQSVQTVTTSVSNEGVHTYECVVSLEFSSVSDVVQNFIMTDIRVQGPVVPNPPLNITATNIQYNRATIEWTVHSIAYDPETYIILYNTNTSSVERRSDSTNSSDDITQTSLSRSLTLEGLELFTTYNYRVQASNSHGTRMSDMYTFTTTGFNVSLTGGSVEANSTITLVCTVIGGLNASSTTFSFFKSDTLLGSSNTSNMYSFVAEVSNAGSDYTCEVAVMIGSDYFTVRSNFAEVLVTIPSPDITIAGTPPLSSVYYSGQVVTLRCSITVQITGVSADFVITGPNGQALVNSGRMILSNTDGGLNVDVTFTAISKAMDEGNYSCVVTLSSSNSSIQESVTNSTASMSQFISINDPGLNVALTRSSGRILDISPYNMITLTCTATTFTLTTSPLNLTKMFRWTYTTDRAGLQISSRFTSSDLDQPTSTSVLTRSFSTASVYTYTCLASLNLQFDVVQSTSEIAVNIQGPTLPISPTLVFPTDVSHSSANIHWTIPSISYDPETYIVMCGTDLNILEPQGVSIAGVSDIEVTDASYFSVIDNLLEQTLYHCRVQSTNSAGTRSSDGLASFTTSSTLSTVAVTVSPITNPNNDPEAFVGAIVGGVVGVLLVIVLLVIVFIATFIFLKRSKGENYFGDSYNNKGEPPIVLSNISRTEAYPESEQHDYEDLSKYQEANYEEMKSLPLVYEEMKSLPLDYEVPLSQRDNKFECAPPLPEPPVRPMTPQGDESDMYVDVDSHKPGSGLTNVDSQKQNRHKNAKKLSQNKTATRGHLDKIHTDRNISYSSMMSERADSVEHKYEYVTNQSSEPASDMYAYIPTVTRVGTRSAGGMNNRNATNSRTMPIIDDGEYI